MLILYNARGMGSLCGIVWEGTDYFVGVVAFAGFMTVGVLVSSCVGFQVGYQRVISPWWTLRL